MQNLTGTYGPDENTERLQGLLGWSTPRSPNPTALARLKTWLQGRFPQGYSVTLFTYARQRANDRAEYIGSL